MTTKDKYAELREAMAKVAILADTNKSVSATIDALIALGRLAREQLPQLLADLDAANSGWTDKAPTEPGWYWCNDPRDRISIKKVFIRPGHKYLAIWTEMDGYLSVSKLGCNWAGPINPPTDKEHQDV